MNADSITRLTTGLFDNVKNMKSRDNFSYDKNKDLVNNMNQVHMGMDIPASEDSLYKYPAEQIKEISEDMEDVQEEYDDAMDTIQDEEFEKSKYDKLLPDAKNPLDQFYNELLNEKALERMKPESRKKIKKNKEFVSTATFMKEFDKFVKTVDKKQVMWLSDYDIFNYIVKKGRKMVVAGTKKEMDTKKTATAEKLRYLDKIIKKSNFTEQVCKKFIEKYSFTPKLITDKEIDSMMKPFYKKCLVKAFEKKIKYTRK